MPNCLTTLPVAAAALLCAALPASAQDRRTVAEPAFPPSCAVLSAQLQIAGGEPSSETAFDTARIQAALNACAAGQSVELARAGANTAFLSGPLTLPAGVGLIVDGGVTLFASRNPADYQISGAETCGTVGTNGNGCKNLITIAGAGSSIMGYGVIDGRGQDALLVNGAASAQNWWDVATAANGHGQQNNFVLVQGGGNSFVLYKITLRNPAMFHVVWKGSGFTAWGVKISTPYTARNTDGIDPSGTDITITKSFISDGDDDVAVSASSNSAYITLSQLQTYSGHGISVGSFTKGGLNAMLVDRVNMAGTSTDGSGNGLRIKSAQDRGGLVQNVTYQNMCIRDHQHLVILDPYYDSTPGSLIPQYQNITYRNLHFLSEGKVQLQGYDASHASSITFDNVVFDNLSANDLNPAPQYLSLTLGPGAVYPAFLQSLSGTGVSVSGSAPASNTGAYDCTNAFPQTVGELYLSTSSGTNLTSASFDGPATFTLEATAQPALSQVSYGSWTGTPALTSGVEFRENGAIVGTGSLGFNGTLATLTLSNVGGGAHTYTAHYPGDAHYPAFDFGSVAVTVNSAAQIASSAQLTAPSAATYGDDISLASSVTGAQGTPTGTVHFSADGNSLGSADLVNGTATLPIAPLVLTPGNHQIVATYGGDVTYAASSSAPQALAVAKSASAISLSAPSAPVLVNTPVTLTATVGTAGTSADGSVTFLNGATAIGTIALANNRASLRVTPAAIGTLSLTASYSGGANYLPSTSAAQTLTVVAPVALAATPGSVSLPGQASISLTPQAGFSGAVDLTCATSSAAIHCALSQSTLNLTAPTTVTLTISSGAQAARLAWPLALPAFGLLLLSKRRRRLIALIALIAAGCGKTTTQPAAQTVTVTAHAGQTSVSTQVTVG